ncbi:MAG: rhodanese-like domain-containing protein [Melioribacteraceae bacterium]|nr:rhodanese-like domain-containing protein [Melioribacteraceae bacterium]
MNELRKLFYLLLIIPLLVVNTGCSDDDDEDPAINEAEVLVKYLEDGGGNPINNFPSMIKSSAVYTNLTTGADQYIIDIRSAADFGNGHIEGAVNVSANDVLDHYESNNLGSKEVVVIACYSGQTAAWVTGLMHTVGYTNVKDMKWGMSSWNQATKGSWVNNISNARASELVTNAAAKAEAGDMPALSTGKSDPIEILRDRVETIFAEGFGAAKTSNAAVFDDLSGHYIVNYWTQEHYDWGHIPGAMQYTPKADLDFDTYLKTLPTDQTVVIYCYTGQTSAHVAGYLRVLGYDAKSLVFGVNGMAHDTMPGTTFQEATEVHDYPLVQ